MRYPKKWALNNYKDPYWDKFIWNPPRWRMRLRAMWLVNPF